MRIIFFILVLFFSFFVRASDTQLINLIISVDWEGFSLEDHNLEAFKKFRDSYPQIKIVHFLNAAYFLQPDAAADVIRTKMNSVIREGDELGLHIHAFETLLKAAGVAYRESETFWGRKTSDPIFGVRGHDVPLTLFSEEEIRKLIRMSVQILEKNGFRKLNSFRAGGWAASPEVLSALIKEGILVDSSAVPPEIIKNVTGGDLPLYNNIVNKLWKDTNIQSDTAYEINTSVGKIVEIPNNFALADYFSGIAVFRTFKNLLEKLDFTSGRPVNFHYGFHQETAAQYIGEVRYALDHIFNYIQAYRIEMNSITFQEARVISDQLPYCRNLVL
jgi:hypothetical protein